MNHDAGGVDYRAQRAPGVDQQRAGRERLNRLGGVVDRFARRNPHSKMVRARSQCGHGRVAAMPRL